MSSHRAGRLLCGAIALALAGGLVAPVQAAPSDVNRARMAAGYLASRQCRGADEPRELEQVCAADDDRGAIIAFSPIGSTADAVASLIAARTGQRVINRAVGYLRDKTAGGEVLGDPDVGLRGKVVLAVVAAGRNPRDFGGVDLVASITDLEQPDGRYGPTTEVFSQATMLLALVAAQEPPSAAAVQWLKDAQCGDGGWQFDEPSGPADDGHCSLGAEDFTTTDSNTTSLALQALAALTEEPAINPFPFLRSLRDPDEDHRGWGFTAGFTTTDANSTALVIQAYVADERRVPRGGLGALRGLQYKLCGKNHAALAFTYDDTGKRTGPDVGATIAAIPGLLKRAFPIAHRDPTHPALLCTVINN